MYSGRVLAAFSKTETERTRIVNSSETGISSAFANSQVMSVEVIFKTDPMEISLLRMQPFEIVTGLK